MKLKKSQLTELIKEEIREILSTPTIDEVEDDKLEKRKEYNKELEKTKELMDDLTD